jgi:hypothetical protein
LQVGGLPVSELNHLELQFLLLNDFRLGVPVEELEAYATMLVEFYAREIVAQRREVKDSSRSHSFEASSFEANSFEANSFEANSFEADVGQSPEAAHPGAEANSQPT